ncbi:ABC transporter permease [Antarcticimicrobium luteum]|uniref:ABC transporter permease n=1 Tax=Antarcticimicrobium luteum TaxID=2547397 RepID=A0A4R5UQN5_9RHOB|nr:ABC transporter permease [Antarcticimicrobium luteum]TDK41380.1 ABC transporter permease [Antarcticimicrobium luteum]
MRILFYFLPKLAVAAITMLGVSALVFLSLRMIPGGYADVLLGPFVTPEAREAIAVRYGLDQPLLIQYLNWLGALFQGDLGVSMVTRAPVLDEFLRRAPVTLELALLALIVALAGGLPLGILAGIAPPDHRGGLLARLVGALGASVPDFVLGSLLIFVFSVWSLWLRVGGYVGPIEDPVGNLRVMLLPALTLSLFGIALVLRTTRDAVLRVMTEGHITTALARGERPIDIVRLHVLRNAAIPVVTVVTTYFGFLLGGAVVVEVLFSIPGIGFFIFSGLENRDYAIVQAGVLIAAAVFITINMLADLAYALIDPRVGSGRH